MDANSSYFCISCQNIHIYVTLDMFNSKWVVGKCQVSHMQAQGFGQKIGSV